MMRLNWKEMIVRMVFILRPRPGATIFNRAKHTTVMCGGWTMFRTVQRYGRFHVYRSTTNFPSTEYDIHIHLTYEGCHGMYGDQGSDRAALPFPYWDVYQFRSTDLK
jgi:hypothetical protein